MDENMTVLQIELLEQAERELVKIGCDPRGVQMMKSKAVFRTIKVEHIRTKAANLLKQTFLSKGAEVAVTKGAADLSAEYTDVLLMATVKQYRQAVPNLKMQPWGLSRIAEQIEKILDNLNKPSARTYSWPDKKICFNRNDKLIIGDIDIAEEKYDVESVIDRIKKMQSEGANAIEFVTEGVRREITVKEELVKLLPFLSQVMLQCDLPVIVRAAQGEIVKGSLACGVHIIDIDGGFKEDTELARLIAEYHVPVIITYTQGKILSSDELMKEICVFLQKSISIGISEGIDSEKIIIAPCGRFFENCEFNFRIIEEIDRLKIFGCPILIDFIGEETLKQVSRLSAKEQGEIFLAAVVLSQMKGVQIFRSNEVNKVTSMLNTLKKIRGVGKIDEDFN